MQEHLHKVQKSLQMMIIKATSVLAIVTIVGLAVTTAIILFGVRQTGQDAPMDFGIILDAGSSHTTVTLFKWLEAKVDNTGVVHEVTACKTEHGIDDAGADVALTVSEILPCVAKVSASVDNSHPTPVYLGATAGMRLVAEENKTLSDYIFSAIKTALVDFKSSEAVLDIESVNIIPGSVEGASAWISTNYLLKTLNIDQKDEQKATVGIMDMGGASKQIAYEDVKGTLPDADVITLDLYGQSYRVRASSDLCFGGDAIWQRYLFMLIRDQNSTINARPPGSSPTVSSPCMLKGQKAEISGAELTDNPCVETASGEKVDESTTYTFIGSGSFTKCQAVVQRMTRSCTGDFNICMITEPQPPPDGLTIIAMTNYVHVKDTLLLGETTTKKDFINAADTFCGMKWSDVVDKPNIYNVNDIFSYCLLGQFIPQMFADVYRFSDSTWTSIEFRNKISGHSIGWSLGYMINATGALNFNAI